MKEIFRVLFSHIEVPNYELGNCPTLERQLSYYDSSAHTLIPKGYIYDSERRCLLIPRAIDLYYLEQILDRNAVMEHQPITKPKKIKVVLTTEPRDDEQRQSLAFLLGVGDYSYTKNYSQLGLNLATGMGKTFSGVAATTLYGERTLIITHVDKIKKQWTKSYLDFTDIKEDEIVDITGSDIIDHILGYEKMYRTESKNKELDTHIRHAKVFTVNHRTLQIYGSSNGWSNIGELFTKLKIGTKIYDECHLELNNIVYVDLYTDVKRTLYLTATMKRSDREENRLFEFMFRHMPRFGEKLVENKRKHINYIACIFNSHPLMSDVKNMRTYYGFNTMNYSNYFGNSENSIIMLIEMINKFLDKEGKILIMCGTIDACDKIKNELEKEFSNIEIGIYHSKVSANIKEEQLDKKIIVSTSKSCGTGVDIRGLRFLINCETYSSSVTADQVCGRLREYSPDDFSIYCEIIDRGFLDCYRMYKNREKVFKTKCNKIAVLDLTKKK